MFNVQRAITPKMGKSELSFMCSARYVIVLYICVKCCENIRDGISVMERTRVHDRNGYVQCSEVNNSKHMLTRVMVHVFCSSSHDALHRCEVSWKYLKRYQSYGVDTKF